MQNRREFIRQGCAACVGVIGLGLLAAELESCKTADPNMISFSKNTVSVPISQMEGKKYLLIKSASLEYDLVLVKKSAQEYFAIKMICSHQQNPLEVTTSGFFCAAHGSEFDFDGNMKKGPAFLPLRKFPVTVGKKSVLISLSA